MSLVGQKRKSRPCGGMSALPPVSGHRQAVSSCPKSANNGLILAPVDDADVGAAVRRTTHRSVVAGFQKRNRNPTVGAMLLRWRKPKANPPFTCVNMTPE
jgi:hypothetical protein